MKHDAVDQPHPVDGADVDRGKGEAKQEIVLSLSHATQNILDEEARKQGTSISNLVEQFAQNLQQAAHTEHTASQQSCLELQQRLEELQTLFEVLPICVGIAQDAECQQIRVNPAFSKLLGGSLSPDAADSAAADRPAADRPAALPFRVFRHGQELPRHQLPLQYAARQQTEVRDAEIDIVHNDGTVSNLYGYAAPLLNAQGQVRGAVSAFLDVTALRQIEAELRRSEARFRRLIETSVFGVAIGDFSGKISYANDAFLSMIGYTQAERTDLNWIELTPPEQRATEQDFAAIFAQNGSVPPFEKDYIHKQGHRVPILMGGALLDEPASENELAIKSENEAIDLSEGDRLAQSGITTENLNNTEEIISGNEEVNRNLQQADHLPEAVTFCIDLTRLKQTEATLREQEEQFRFLAEAIPHFVWTARADGSGEYYNRRCLDYLGVTAEQLQFAKWTQFVHPDDVAAAVAVWTTALMQKIENQVEVRIRRADGKYRWFESRMVPFKAHQNQAVRWFATCTDIHDRKQAEAALRQSELNFRTLADAMPQLFWTTRPDGYHDYFNQRWYEYTGTTLEQTQNGWSHLLHPDEQQRCLEAWNESLRTGKDYNMEHRLKQVTTGTYRWFLARAFPLRAEDGQILHWFGSCTDIHDQKCALEERDRALAQEQIAREQAETANRIKDEFLAVLSHELRSPLNPILGWTKLLRSRQFDPATTERALETIERNAKLQTQLIEDLLDISRVLCGKMVLEAAPVDLVGVVEAALDTVHLAAEAKKIRIITQFEHPIGQISGDPNRLQQVVWNLLSNAVKFTSEGGSVQVRLSSRADDAEFLAGRTAPQEAAQPELRRQKTQAFVQLQVKDTGKGINPNFLPYVFESFRQEDGKTTRKFGGLGLGLAIVRHLVELHGGSVKAESPGEGRGATFTVRLPVLADDQPSADFQPTSGLPSLSLQGRRVLVVDDETDMQELALVILQQSGATVQVTNSATEALNLLQSFQPHLLISDIGMPEVDGYMLLRQIRQQYAEREQQIPAIAVTAYATESDRQQALEAGFQRHLTKPIEPQELVKIIQEVLA